MAAQCPEVLLKISQFLAPQMMAKNLNVSFEISGFDAATMAAKSPHLLLKCPVLFPYRGLQKVLTGCLTHPVGVISKQLSLSWKLSHSGAGGAGMCLDPSHHSEVVWLTLRSNLSWCKCNACSRLAAN